MLMKPKCVRVTLKLDFLGSHCQLCYMQSIQDPDVELETARPGFHRRKHLKLNHPTFSVKSGNSVKSSDIKKIVSTSTNSGKTENSVKSPCDSSQQSKSKCTNLKVKSDSDLYPLKSNNFQLRTNFAPKTIKLDKRIPEPCSTNIQEISSQIFPLDLSAKSELPPKKRLKFATN